MILEEQPTLFPKCKRCGSQVTTWCLRNRHYDSIKCWLRGEFWIIRTALQHCFEASLIAISMNAEPLDSVAELPYLGFTVAYNDIYWKSLYQNLWKARRRWEMLGKVVTNMGETVRERGMMYKELVQSVLLYGIKSWVATE